MKKFFTKFFGLTLLVLLVGSLSVVKAQVDTDCLVLTLEDVELVTDITTKCDSDLIQYKVADFPTGTEYSFNGVGDTTAAGFTPDSTIWVKEGVGFVVQVRTSATCYSKVLTVPGEDLIIPVSVDTLLLTHPLCYGDEGELTVVVEGTEAFEVHVVDSTAWQGPDYDAYPKYTGTQFVVDPGMKYYVSVVAANGCTSTEWDSVTVNAAPNQIFIADVNTNIDTLLCVGDTAIISVLGIAGGTAPYIVELSDGQSDTLAAAGDFDFKVDMPGTYTATVTDSLGCSQVSDSMAVVAGPDPIAFEISLDDVSCADSTTGVIYIHDIMGGAPGATYEGQLQGADTTMVWKAAVSDTVMFEGLAAGYYSVWIRDAACMMDSTAYDNPNGTGNVISVQAPTGIQLTVVVDTAVCLGDSSMIMASATGGTGSYEFSVDNGSTWGTAGTEDEWTVYFGGPYTVVVRDAGTTGCEIAYTPITLTAPDAVSLDDVVTVSPTCPGGNDGVINITASGGAGTLWYSLDSMSWKENHIFAVFAGDYTVYVRTEDCENDVAQADVVVMALDTNKIEVSLVDTVNECNGVNSNMFYVQLPSWANQAGEHRTPNVYYSDDMGDIYVNNTDTLPFDSHYMGGAQYLGEDFDAGTYYFWAIDNFGCIADNDLDGEGDYVMVTITEEGPLTVSGWVTGAASCYGNYDGEMTIVAGDGTPTKYGHANTLQAAMALPDAAMTDWPVDADSVTIQVGKGTYYVVVTNDCDEKAYDGPFVVDGLDMVTIEEDALDVTDIVCFGDTTGVIVVAAAEGGTEDFTYTLQKLVDGVWMNVANYVDVTDTTFINLPADTFKVVVADALCDGAETDAIIVDGPAEGVTFTLDSMDITCNGASDGLVVITVTGGTAPYEFQIGTTSWQPIPDTTKTVVITEPGQYTITVRDDVECPAPTQTFTIEEPDAIMLTVDGTDVSAGSCAAPDGVIDVMVYGGNTDTFNIYIPGLDTVMMVTDSAETWTGVPAGTYTVIAEEVNGNDCYAMMDVTIGNPDSLVAVATVLDSVGCYGAGGGEILVEVTGGNPAYIIELDNGTVKDSLSGDSVVFDNLMAGDYTITVFDSDSCYTILGLISISQSDSITLNATWMSDITCDPGYGQFSVQAGGGTGHFLYYAAQSILPAHILVPDPMTSEDWQADSIFTVDMAATYIVWAYDTINGCLIGGEENDMGNPVNEWRVKIAEPAIVVTVNAAVSDDSKCYGALSEITVPADSIIITLDGAPLVDPDYYVMIDSVMNDTLSDVGPGTYVVKVMHESGCYGTDTVVIAEQEVFEVMLTKGDGEFSCPDVVEGYIEAVVHGGGDTIMYQLWQDGALKTDYQADSSFLVQIGFDYTVVVMDENGCTDTSTVLELDPVDEAAFGVKDVSCYGDSLASAKIMVMGELGRDFTLNWEEMETGKTGVVNGIVGDTVLAQAFEYDEKGTTDRHYIMQVIDSEGCPSDMDTLTFKRVDGPLQVVNRIENPAECKTRFAFEIAGGTAPYSVWVDTMLIADSIGFYEQITIDLSGGEHKVYVIDAQECQLEEDVDLNYSIERTDSVEIYEGDTAHYMDEAAMLDTMLVGGVYEFIYDSSMDSTSECSSLLTVTVIENERVAPVLDSLSPMDTIADNKPDFVLTFVDDVMLGENGYLTVTAVGDSVATLELMITEDMFSGNTLTITYDWMMDGRLDTLTSYVVELDSGVVMGAGAVWAGPDSTWTFTTGADVATSIDDGVVVDELEFKVYPNPFNDYIKVDNYDKLSRIVITNIAGQRVLDIENPTYEIRTGNLVTGVYVVSLIQDNSIVKSERIIKR